MACVHADNWIRVQPLTEIQKALVQFVNYEREQVEAAKVVALCKSSMVAADPHAQGLLDQAESALQSYLRRVNRTTPAEDNQKKFLEEKLTQAMHEIYAVRPDKWTERSRKVFGAQTEVHEI